MDWREVTTQKALTEMNKFAVTGPQADGVSRNMRARMPVLTGGRALMGGATGAKAFVDAVLLFFADRYDRFEPARMQGA